MSESDDVSRLFPLVDAQTLRKVSACWCERCRPITMLDMRMVICPTCGDKRCPHATDHQNDCTGNDALRTITASQWRSEAGINVGGHEVRGSLLAIQAICDLQERAAAPNAGEAAMQRACAELPFGYEMQVCLEEGAGWIDLYDPHGEKVDLTEDMDGGMTPRIIDAIERAIEHDKESK